ncbi:hypothetical protein D3C79_840890 [compost metagenome]
MIAFDTAPLHLHQLAALVIHGKHQQFVGRAAIADIQKAPVSRQVQGPRRPGRGIGQLGQGQALKLCQLAVLIVERHHLRAHFQGQVGLLAVAVKQQMARPATRRQAYRLDRAQWLLGTGAVVSVDKYLVGTQVAGEHVFAVVG